MHKPREDSSKFSLYYYSSIIQSCYCHSYQSYNKANFKSVVALVHPEIFFCIKNLCYQNIERTYSNSAHKIGLLLFNIKLKSNETALFTATCDLIHFSINKAF